MESEAISGSFQVSADSFIYALLKLQLQLLCPNAVGANLKTMANGCRKVVFRGMDGIQNVLVDRATDYRAP